jgi:hypothetical protein
MKNKLFTYSILALLLSYGIYQLYWYSQEKCNLILFVKNESTNPSVYIDIYIDDKLVVSDMFYQTYFYGEEYCLNSSFGIKKITVKLDKKIHYNGYFLLFGVRWVTIIDHSNDYDNPYLIFDFIKKCRL